MFYLQRNVFQIEIVWSPIGCAQMCSFLGKNEQNRPILGHFGGFSSINRIEKGVFKNERLSGGCLG